MVFIGSVVSLDLNWTFSNITNSFMAIPNLIGLLGLSGRVVYETKRIQDKLKEEKLTAKVAKSI